MEAWAYTVVQFRSFWVWYWVNTWWEVSGISWGLRWGRVCMPSGYSLLCEFPAGAETHIPPPFLEILKYQRVPARKTIEKRLVKGTLWRSLTIQGSTWQWKKYTFCTHPKTHWIYPDHAVSPCKNQCKYQSAENPGIKRVFALSRIRWSRLANCRNLFSEVFLAVPQEMAI